MPGGLPGLYEKYPGGSDAFHTAVEATDKQFFTGPEFKQGLRPAFAANASPSTPTTPQTQMPSTDQQVGMVLTKNIGIPSPVMAQLRGSGVPLRKSQPLADITNIGYKRPEKTDAVVYNAFGEFVGVLSPEPVSISPKVGPDCGVSITSKSPTLSKAKHLKHLVKEQAHKLSIKKKAENKIEKRSESYTFSAMIDVDQKSETSEKSVKSSKSVKETEEERIPRLARELEEEQRRIENDKLAINEWAAFLSGSISVREKKARNITPRAVVHAVSEVKKEELVEVIKIGNVPTIPASPPEVSVEKAAEVTVPPPFDTEQGSEHGVEHVVEHKELASLPVVEGVTNIETVPEPKLEVAIPAETVAEQAPVEVEQAIIPDVEVEVPEVKSLRLTPMKLEFSRSKSPWLKSRKVDFPEIEVPNVEVPNVEVPNVEVSNIEAAAVSSHIELETVEEHIDGPQFKTHTEEVVEPVPTKDHVDIPRIWTHREKVIEAATIGDKIELPQVKPPAKPAVPSENPSTLSKAASRLIEEQDKLISMMIMDDQHDIFDIEMQHTMVEFLKSKVEKEKAAKVEQKQNVAGSRLIEGQDKLISMMMANGHDELDIEMQLNMATFLENKVEKEKAAKTEHKQVVVLHVLTLVKEEEAEKKEDLYTFRARNYPEIGPELNFFSNDDESVIEVIHTVLSVLAHLLTLLL
jgi:hypothetical protein